MQYTAAVAKVPIAVAAAIASTSDPMHLPAASAVFPNPVSAVPGMLKLLNLPLLLPLLPLLPLLSAAAAAAFAAFTNVERAPTYPPTHPPTHHPQTPKPAPTSPTSHSQAFHKPYY